MEQKNYPIIYNQNDYGAAHLGTSTVDTIQSGGCFDCSCAMKACYYGHRVDPLQMNKLFVDNSVYYTSSGEKVTATNGGDLLPDNAVSQVFPDIRYIKTFDYEPIPTDLGSIKSLLSDPATTLTIRINFGGGNLHFVEAVACDGYTLHIANPISGQIEDFQKRYGNPVTARLHVLVFTGPVQQPQQTAQTSPDQTPSPLALRFSQAIQKSTNFDKVADFLGISPEQRVTPEAAQLVIDRYNSMQHEIEGLHSKVSLLEAPVTTVSATPTQEAVQKPPVFSNGQQAVSGTPATEAPTAVKTVKSPQQQANPTTLSGLVKAVFRLLFL